MDSECGTYMKVGAFLPAKGSSDRIPSKNTMLLDYMLNVGCGQGFLNGLIAKRCKGIKGVDYSEKTVATDRNTFPTMEYAHISQIS